MLHHPADTYDNAPTSMLLSLYLAITLGGEACGLYLHRLLANTDVKCNGISHIHALTVSFNYKLHSVLLHLSRLHNSSSY